MSATRVVSTLSLLFFVVAGSFGLVGCAEEEFECCHCTYDGPGCDSSSCSCSAEPEYTQDDCAEFCRSNLECGADAPSSSNATSSC